MTKGHFLKGIQFIGRSRKKSSIFIVFQIKNDIGYE